MRSLPDCSGRCRCSHTALVVAIASIVVGAQILRVRAREPNPADAVDRAHRPQQLGEERAHGRGSACAPRCERQVAAVGVHVLPEQGDLGDALRGEALDLGDERVEGSADLGPAHRGHDAERARVVAADLDRDPRAVALLALGGERRGERGRVVGSGRLEHLDDRPLALATSSMRSAARCTLWVPNTTSTHGAFARIALALVLREAAAHDDLHAGAAVLDGLQHAEVAVELVVGVLTDAAAVEHHDVGVLGVGGRDETIGLEEPGDPLGVVLVHLTPEGADEVRASHPLRLGAGQPATPPHEADEASRHRRSRGSSRRRLADVGAQVDDLGPSDGRGATDRDPRRASRIAVRVTPSMSTSVNEGMHTGSIPSPAT